MRQNILKKVQRIRSDLEKLTDEEIAEKYKANVHNHFLPQQLLNDENTQNFCDEFTEIVTEEATITIGRGINLTEGIFKACEEIRLKKQTRFTSQETLEEYKTANRKVKKTNK